MHEYNVFLFIFRLNLSVNKLNRHQKREKNKRDRLFVEDITQHITLSSALKSFLFSIVYRDTSTRSNMKKFKEALHKVKMEEKYCERAPTEMLLKEIFFLLLLLSPK